MQLRVSLQLLAVFIGLPFVYSAPVKAALQRGPNDVYVRIVDVGAGLCFRRGPRTRAEFGPSPYPLNPTQHCNGLDQGPPSPPTTTTTPPSGEP